MIVRVSDMRPMQALVSRWRFLAAINHCRIQDPSLLGDSAERGFRLADLQLLELPGTLA